MKDLNTTEVLQQINDHVEASLTERFQHRKGIYISPGSEYLSPDQCATYLSVSRATIVKLAQRGYLKRYPLSSRMTRYKRTDLDDVMRRINEGEIIMPLADEE